MVKFNKKLMYISLFIYIILLIWIIIFKWTKYEAALESIITFRPLSLSDRFNACKMSFVFKGFDPVDLILNILLFLPMGLYFVLLLKRKHLILLIGLATTFIFEISQFFTCIGMFNSFDVLGNMIGCVLGFILFKFINRYLTDKLINIINYIIITLFSPLCIYAIVMTIMNFHYYL